MNKYDLIPFIGIGSLGVTTLNYIPPDIKEKVYSIFLARSGVSRTVSADIIIVYLYNYKNNIINNEYLSNIQFLLKFNTDKVFLVVNLGGDSASECAISLVEFLVKSGKKVIAHVSAPFDFQSLSVKQKAYDAVNKLNKLCYKIFIGDNGEILNDLSGDSSFHDFFRYTSLIIYDEFRYSFGLIPDKVNKHVKNKTRKIHRRKISGVKELNHKYNNLKKFTSKTSEIIDRKARPKFMDNEFYIYIKNNTEQYDLSSDLEQHTLSTKIIFFFKKYFSPFIRKVKLIFIKPKPIPKNIRITKEESIDNQG